MNADWGLVCTFILNSPLFRKQKKLPSCLFVSVADTFSSKSFLVSIFSESIAVFNTIVNWPISNSFSKVLWKFILQWFWVRKKNFLRKINWNRKQKIRWGKFLWVDQSWQSLYFIQRNFFVTMGNLLLGGIFLIANSNLRLHA